jgi:hypothetical protein
VTALSECEPAAAPGGGTRQTGRGWLVWCDDPQLSVSLGLDAQVASRWEAVQVQLDNVTALRDDAQARGWDSETTRHGRVVDSIEGQLRRINVDTGAGLFLPLDAEHESRLMRAGGSGTAAAGCRMVLSTALIRACAAGPTGPRSTNLGRRGCAARCWSSATPRPD